ncbi:MAG: SdrD B-like domain-containing protein [Cyanobacteria bacterium P01_G01_bin.19]
MQTNQSIVFIDSQVADYQFLANGILSGKKVVILQSDRDGVEQITEVLSQKPYSTVHIVSHGAPGCLYLGNTQLSLDTLSQYQSQLKTWFSLPPLLRGGRGDLLIYGCNVAAGDAGAEFIDKLHQITDANVAASTTIIGNSDLGGNWHLDYQTSNTSSFDLAFTSEVQKNYAGVLEEDENTLAPDLAEEVVEDIATISTDLDDYAPGSTATITGENFEPGETVELQILHTDGTPNTGGGHEPWQVTDGGNGDLDGLANGTIITTWFVNPDDSGGSAFELTAAGLSSGKTANHYFTDSDPAVQFFYVPTKEADLLTGIKAIATDGTNNFNSATEIDSIISLTISTDNTVVYYDHWEDGFESNLNSPIQTSTQIWGDNNPDNGIAPGFTTDVLNAGDFIVLDNDGNSVAADTQTVVDYDGQDKIGASKAIVLTRAAFPDDPDGTLIGGAVEVYDTTKWGLEYQIPIGQDLATGTDPTDNFDYTSLSVTASTDGTTLTLNGSQVDIDGDLDVDANDVLDEGDTYFFNGGINTGDIVEGSNPIQAQLLTGNVGSTYASRSYTLLPTNEWSNSYYTPVGTVGTTGATTDVFLYNPTNTAGGAIDITVTTQEGTTTVNVPEGETVRHSLTTDSGAHFETTDNTESGKFFAVSAFDSENSTNDWGFSLVPESNLTPVVQLAWAPGNGNKDQNASPIWVMATTPTTIYIDYDGDEVAPNTDINGGQYDEARTLSALEVTQIVDTKNNDFDQTGIRIYTIDGKNLVGAWGQDPSAATAGTSLDLGTTILPLPIATSWKTSELVSGNNANGNPGDANSDGNVDPGDTIEYTINIQNDGVVVLGNVNVSDIVPEGTAYVPGSLEVDGVSIGDDNTGTTFPLDDDGLDNGIDSGKNIGNIDTGGSAAVSFQVTINDPYDGALEGVTNSANVDSDTDSFTVAVNQPIDFTDVIQTKTLYLSNNSGNNLDRINSTTATTDSKLSFSAATVFDELVGVDFENTTDDSVSPTNWTVVSSGSTTTPTTLTNLNDETGANSGYGLQIEYGGSSASVSPGTTTISTVPSHSPSLTGVDDYIYSLNDGSFTEKITATWTGLSANTAYDVYVFGSQSLVSDPNFLTQSVSITGDTTVNFDQSNIDANTLFINNRTAINTDSLEDYAVEVVSDSSGEIAIEIEGTNFNFAALSGLAIDPVEPIVLTSDNETFSQSISMQSDFGMPSGQPVEVTAYVDITSDAIDVANPANNKIAANLTYGTASENIISFDTPSSVSLESDSIYRVTWNGTLSNNAGISAGESISLDITNNDPDFAFDLRYDGAGTYASTIDLPTINVINVSDIGIYDANNGGGNLINAASNQDTVYVRVEVEDPFGDYDITSLNLDIKDAGGASVLSGGVATLTGDTGDIDAANVNGKRIYEYEWTPTTSINPGNYTVEVQANEGLEGTINDTASTTISLNDGSVPNVVIGDSTVTEGTALVFDVQLSGGNPHTTDIVLDLTTTDGTATEVADYETTVFEYSIDGGATWISAGGSNGTEVTIPVGNTGIKVRIDSTNDATDESDETFILGVGSVVSGTVGNTADTGLGTILDNDNPPAISIDDVNFTEGDSNTKAYTFTVTLDNPSTETITVDYATADGTAQVNEPVDGNDYTATNGTLTFAPGETSKTITVTVNGDTPVEPDETFNVNLSNPTNASISDSQGVGTILNDDGAPLFSINDVTIVEGDSGTQTLEFTVTRTGDTTVAATVDYATADDSATTGNNDYEANSGTLSFAAGETTQTISITINGDLPPELDESFFVNLSNAINVDNSTAGATIFDSQGVGIIQNDDDSGTISGNVSADTDNDNTADSPLSGVTIELLDSDGNSIDSDSGTAGVQPTTTTTDSNGDYSFTGLALGNYQVQETNLSGYTDVSEVDGSTDGGDDTDSGDNGVRDNIPVVLAADGEVDSGNDFVDEQVGSISGEVLADTNNDDVGDSPLSGVTIELLDGSGDSIDSDPNTSGTQSTTTTTNASGAYSFSDLAPDDYKVRQTNLSNYSDVKDLDTNADGSANGVGGNTDQNLIDVSLSPGEDSTGNDFVDERGVISGNVSVDTSDPGDTTGDDPLANVTVELLDSGSNVVATTATDASGNYSFTDLEPDTYTVRQTDLAGYDSVIDNDDTDDDGAGSIDNDSNSNNNDNELTVDLTGGEADTGNNFVDRAQSGVISGQVLEDTTGNGLGDTALSAVTVKLFADDGITELNSTTTAADGTYSFSVTVSSATTYVIKEENPSNYDSVSDTEGSNDDTITISIDVGESSTGNDFVDEAQPGTISGTVQADTTGNGLGDTNLLNVTVSLLDELGNPVLDGSGLAITAITNSSGQYTFSDVAPGDYLVVESDPTGYSSISDTDSTADSTEDDANNTDTNDNTLAVTLLAGETDDGNDFVDHQNGEISGTVEEDTDNNGSGDSALSGVTVTLKDSLGNTVATETTDSSGNYAFSDVTPGDYTIEETDLSGYSSVSDADNDADATSDDATNSDPNDNTLAVTLLPNETDSGNDFVDEQNGSISGSVTADTDNDNDGDDPISGVTITLRNASDDSTVATTTTDGGGNYSFTDIAPGDYEVVETNSSGYADVNELDSVNDGSNDGDNEAAGTNDDNILSVSLAGRESDTGNDFVDEQTGSISGTVSEDTVGGTGIAGVTITLTNTDTSTVVGTTTTAANGAYSFTDLAPGNYQIDETDLGTYTSVSDVDSDDSDDTNSSTNDNQLIVALSPGESDTANNFVDELETTSGTISGQVLEDTDGDEVGDTPISGVTITLWNSDRTVVFDTTTTLADGTYTFSSVTTGTTYQLEETNNSGYGDVSDTDGDNDNLISVDLTSATSSTGNDFVDGLTASISGVIWSDFDNNGVEGSFEDRVDGSAGGLNLSVTLIGGGVDGVINGSNDTSVAQTVGADGSYSFTGLNPGEEYQVQFPTSATGYTSLTTQDVNSDAYDAIDSDAHTSTGNTATITLNANEDKTDVDAGLLPTTVVSIDGTSTSETLSGTAGNDVIAGFKGEDTLTGGTGNDTFFYNETSDGVDIIKDFTSGEDKIDLTQILANETSYTSGNPFDQGFAKVVDYPLGGAMVQIDFDGSGGNDLAKSFVLIDNLTAAGVDITGTDSSNTDFIF